ncbi:hypothetical protein [Bacteriovorax sp. Seq25_V]|uniref:hypothetical protein n=1 Tax=Bacteriovorax sp. Seq25_V TaxID=1201288 RepID=UPI00038A3153|nr:hypothetical protein [Bacteriovorax sp. Seq25_V]EQC43980.1 hypothetical protein M900_1174 [Bacteriovorax sp. Seq25_V]
MIKIIISLLILSNIFAASDFHSWDKDLADLNLDVNPIELRNRAGCAKDSEFPTQSVFLLVDNTTIGKAAYRLASLTRKDPEETTKLAIKAYRKKLITLTNTIFEKLSNRELPLLPNLTSSLHVPSRYKQIVQGCFEQEDCPELNEYLEKLWANSKLNVPAVRKIVNNYKTDNFHSEESYHKLDEDTRLSCNLLKKFSPIQAHLFGTKPDREVLQKIASRLGDTAKYFGSCDDESIENLKVAGYQLDIRHLDDSQWNKIGFDFWNSLKIYLSWAFKSTTVVDFDYELIIQSTQTEDSILLVSNGCKSIEVPECSNDYLSKSVLAQMAKDDFKKTALELDVLSPVVSGAQDIMLENPFTAVNTDILDLATREDANKWIESLFNNFSGTKAYIKNKLTVALSFYTILTKRLSVSKLSNDLNRYYSVSNFDDDKIKNDIYYMCSEAKFVSSETFSFVKKNITLIKDTNFIDSMKLFFNENSLEDIVNDYEALLTDVNAFCDSLDGEQLFGGEFEVDRSGFKQWYLDKNYKVKNLKSTSEEKLAELNLKPYISYGASGKVICHSPSSCVRESISHILEITRATYYASTFWKSKHKATSSDVFNPYSERVACKVYDPWFKTRATITNFTSDISQAIVSRFTPGVLYSKFSLQPGHVESFNSMVKDGKILFNKNFKKEKVMMELVSDFGPLLGVPCAVSIAGKYSNGYNNLYQFNGVSVGACTAKDSSQIIVNSASDISTPDGDVKSGCFACRLNFESVSNTLTYFNYAIGPVYYLVRSVVRLVKGLSDPDNIARDWEIDLNHLKNTYRRFGYIPKSCVKKLTKGKACLGSSREEKAVSILNSKYNVTILAESKTVFGNYRFKIRECHKPVSVNFRNEDSFEIKSDCKLEKK